VNYWLFKTEPETFSVDDLAGSPRATTRWDGVRNYQARNMLRDDVRVGDRGFLYHSSCAVPAITAIVEVVRAGYPDPSAFDRRSPYYDADSERTEPRWYSVDVRLERRLERPVTLEQLRAHAAGPLEHMVILRKGNRLSVTPLTRDEWRFILSLER